MSTLKTNTIEGSGGDTGTKFTVDNDSTYIEGNSGKSLNFIQATIKGYSTVFDQGDGSQKRTLNISSTSDEGTGHLHYTHTNNYIATSGYVQMQMTHPLRQRDLFKLQLVVVRPQLHH